MLKVVVLMLFTTGACMTSPSGSASPSNVDVLPVMQGVHGPRVGDDWHTEAATPSEMDAGVDAQPDSPGEIDAPLGVDAPMGDAGHAGKPLVLALHGYGSQGSTVYSKFSLSMIDDALGGPAVILDPTGDYHAWDASAAVCCVDHKGGTVDELVQLVTARVAMGDIDVTRVYVWGSSNGAFMAWRLICSRPDLFRAAIIQSGGANSAGDAACTSGEPVAILHIHGTDDQNILYSPPTPTLTTALVSEPYPAGIESLPQEGELAGCHGQLEVVGSAPHVVTLPIDQMTWSGGCDHGYAEHWRIDGGVHDCMFNHTFAAVALAWCDEHRAH